MRNAIPNPRPIYKANLPTIRATHGDGAAYPDDLRGVAAAAARAFATWAADLQRTMPRLRAPVWGASGHEYLGLQPQEGAVPVALVAAPGGQPQVIYGGRYAQGVVRLHQETRMSSLDTALRLACAEVGREAVMTAFGILFRVRVTDPALV